MALRIVINLGEDMKARMTLKTQMDYDQLVNWCLTKREDLVCLRNRKQKAREMIKEEEEDIEEVGKESKLDENTEEVTFEGKYYFTYYVDEYQYTVVNTEDLTGYRADCKAAENPGAMILHFRDVMVPSPTKQPHYEERGDANGILRQDTNANTRMGRMDSIAEDGVKETEDNIDNLRLNFHPNELNVQERLKATQNPIRPHDHTPTRPLDHTTDEPQRNMGNRSMIGPVSGQNNTANSIYEVESKWDGSELFIAPNGSQEPQNEAYSKGYQTNPSYVNTANKRHLRKMGMNNFKSTFDGENWIDFYNILSLHCKTYGLEPQEVVILLNNALEGKAQQLMQLKWKGIIRMEPRTQLSTICGFLKCAFAREDLVEVKKAELLALCQKGMECGQWVVEFELKLSSYLLELSFRNDNSSYGIIHTPLTTNELSRVFIGNSREEVKEYIMREGYRRTNRIQMTLEEAKALANEYSDMEIIRKLHATPAQRRHVNELNKELVCYKCGKPGHVASQCQAPNLANVKCFNCKEYGHYARTCSKPDRRKRGGGGGNNGGGGNSRGGAINIRCRDKGECTYGSSCRFLHSDEEKAAFKLRPPLKKLHTNTISTVEVMASNAEMDPAIVPSTRSDKNGALNPHHSNNGISADLKSNDVSKIHQKNEAGVVAKDISCICDDYCDASDNYGNYRELSDSNTKHQIMASNAERVMTRPSDAAKAMYSIEYLDNQYILTHENDMDAPLRIYETLLTKPMEQITIPKNTIDIEVWKETIHLRGFVDNGASITACGKLIFESFQKYEDNTVRNSVTAGGFDAEKTGQFWNATKRLKLPICHKRFDMILGRDVIDKRHLQIWYFECIPPELCIVGRDAIRLLDLALFSRNDIKRTIYYHKRDKLVGIVPEHEDIDAYLDKIEIKSKGKPGLYKIDENQRVHKLQVKFAKKGDMENALQHPNDSVCQLRVFDREPQHEKVLVHSQNIAAIELNVMQNGDVFSNNYILHTLDESQIAKEGTNAMLIRDLDTAVLTHVEVDGIKYPQCLDEVQFSEIYSKEEVLNCKASLSHMAKCLARSKFDIGKLTKYPPLSVHIKDDSSLRCGGYYPLNATDQTIVNNEIEDWIDHGLCVRMDQSNPKHVVRHTSSLFAVHRMMGVNKEDNSMIVQSRAVSDFKILNSLTEDYIFDNLTIQELMDKCSGATLSNCADIRSWFYHIPLHEDSIPVCALRVKGGIILPSRVIHGLKNAPIYGHELVSKIYQSCALAIQDDLTTPIFEANIDIAKVMAVDKIKELFRISLDHNISLNGKKIKVGFPITNRISRTVSATKTMLMTKHTTTALETKWDKMINKTDLLSFISMLQYIAPHIPHLLLDVVEFKKETLKDVSLPASVEKSKMPLRDKNKKLILNKTQYGKQLFDQIQDRVRNALILSQPDMRLQSKHAFLIIVDTSLDQTGAALAQQKLDEEPFVLRGSAKRKEFYEQIRTRYNLVELYSRSLHDVETRYSATEREMLGIKLAFRKFKRFLILKQFDLVTDCAPLVAIFKLNKDTNNAKLIRWRNETSYYTFRGHHLEGSLMVLVDYLSRGAIPTDPLKPLASPPKLELCGIVQYMVKYGVPTDTHKLTNAQAEINAIHGLFAVAKQQTKKKDTIKIEKTPFVRLQELNMIKTIDTAPTKRLNYDAPEVIQTILSMNKVRADPQYEEWTEFYTMDAIFSVLHRRARQYHDTVLMVDIPPVQKSKKFDAILNEMKCEMNPVMTRAQRKALTAQELNPQTTEITNDQDTLSHGMRMPDVALKDGLYEGIKPQVKAFTKENKNYLYRKLRHNIFIRAKINPLILMRNEQKRIYYNIFKALRDPSYIPSAASVFDSKYIEMLKQKKLSIRDDGLIMYEKKRVLVPPKLRIPLMQLTHIESTQHRGASAMYSFMRKFYYWLHMPLEIRIYCRGCICTLFKANKKGEYYKNKGILAPHTLQPTQPNEHCYLDLFGPMHDKAYIAVMIDGFDGLLKLKRVFPATSYEICKCLNFTWHLQLGYVKKWTSDNAPNLTSGLNEVNGYIHGHELSTTFAYSPWQNLAETKMRSLCCGIGINKYNHDHFGLGTLYSNLDRLMRKPKYSNYNNYLPALEYANNNMIKEHTGYSPNALRMPGSLHTSLLEMNLRLAHAVRLKPADYCVKKIVDYDKYITLLKHEQQLMMKQARIKRAQMEMKRSDEYEQKGSTFQEKDFVIWKPKDAVKNKLTLNEYYGFYVKKVLKPGKKYVIKHAFMPDWEETVIHGHIRLFHKPLWSDPRVMLDGSLKRMDDMEEHDDQVDRSNE
eukprot:141066_1